MTSVAKFHLTETDVRALTQALETDDRLAALPVGLSETAGGRWEVLIYFSEATEKDEVAALRGVAHSLFDPRSEDFSVKKLPKTDWVAKSLEGLPPVRAGRFFVHGSHHRNARRANDIAIEIEAGQAFGSGHHGTTAACLTVIDRLARTEPITNALDIGTGSGVLAIAIAKAAKAPVLASDIDPVAIRVARENIRLNGAAGHVNTVVAGSLAKRVFRMSAPYDLIVANILAEPLAALASQITSVLAPTGNLVLSGLIPEQRARIVAAYRGRGLPLSQTMIRDGWLTVVFRRANRELKGGTGQRRLS